MRRKYILSICLLVCLFIKGNGQVNLQTGSAVFSLPMFNWQDSKSRLSLNVGLNYNSGNGLKVNEIASNAGLGWNIIAGGIITRTQVGQPDDQKPNDLGIYNLSNYPAGYLYNPRAGNIECPIGLTKYPIYRTDGGTPPTYKQHNSVTADKELDYFNFNFNGRSGQFILNKNNPNQCYTIGNSKIKIAFEIDLVKAEQENCRTTIMAFQIIDENGVIYKFRKICKSAVLKSKPCGPNRNLLGVEPVHDYGSVIYKIGQALNSYIVNEWHLTEVVDPLANRSYTLSYIDQNSFYDGLYMGYTVSFIGTTYHRNEDGSSTSSTNSNNGYIEVSYNKFVGNIPFLSEINCPDGYKVTFTQNKSQARYDMGISYPLKSIDILLNNQIQKGYDLETAYMLKNQISNSFSTNTNMARLCLISFQEFGPNRVQSLPKYTFDYYLGTNASEDFVPPLNCPNRDYGGYYNGSNANLTGNSSIDPSKSVENLTFEELVNVCFVNRAPGPIGVGSSTNPMLITNYGKFLSTSRMNVNSKSGYAKNGLLKQIHFPMKGFIEFEYEQNIGKINGTGNEIEVAGVHVSKIKTYDANNATNPSSITKYEYKKQDGSSSLFGIEMPENRQYFSSRYDAVDKLVHVGWCEWRYSLPGTPEIEIASKQTNLSSQITQAIVESVVSLGLTIYDLIVGTNIGLIYSVIEFLVNWGISCAGQVIVERNITTFSSINLNASNPLPVEFSCVSVEQIGNTGNNGSVRYEFTNPEINPFWNSYGDNPNFTNKPRYGTWLYGLPKKVTILDKNNKFIKETTHFYNETTDPIIGNISCNCLPNFSGSVIAPDWELLADANLSSNYTTTNTANIILSQYGFMSGRLELAQTVEREYKQNYSGSETDPSNFTENTVAYEYNPNNYQVKKITSTQSNGDKNIKEVYYPNDYTSTGIIQSLVNNNVINIPIASYNSVQKNGSSTQKYLTANVTNYTSVNGDIKPTESYTARITEPVYPFVFNPNNPLYFPSTLIKIQDLQYDTRGNLIGLKDESNRVIANIYGYDDKFIVGSVVNADLIIDKPAYTSFETSDLGGWTITGTPVFENNNGVTGTKALSLTTGISISATLNIAKPYILSFWSNTTTVTVTNATLMKSNPTVNGFTYYEYEIAAGNSNTVVAGTGNIDELRVYPSNSRMKTVTYHPLLGKIAACDENNRITYYEYDDLGRMLFIRDEKQNILKMYEYNYKN